MTTKKPEDQKTPAAKKGRPAKGARSLTMRFNEKILAQVDKAVKKAKLTRTAWLELAAVEKLERG